jgi:arylsulfatase A-like enzyme
VFCYVAYTAPHWPLHAHEDDIAAYDGVFAEGWDVLRERRMERQRKLGLFGDEAQLSDRDPSQPAWVDVEPKSWQERRMQVYAAQVTRMDAGIGRILDTLRRLGELDNTIVIFLSDNGASPEDLPLVELERFRTRTDIVRMTTRDGQPVRIGNHPDVPPGAEDTYASYGRAWANLSNTPFRYYKRWVHEGGIAAPFVVRWPGGELPAGSICRQPFQLVDVLPTILEATGVPYPWTYQGREIPALEGGSMLPAWRGEPAPDVTLFWEHTGNAAVRRGPWKLVRAYPDPWELYDMERDRSELVDRANELPEIVAELTAAYDEWSTRVGVIPWEKTLAIYAERKDATTDAAG